MYEQKGEEETKVNRTKINSVELRSVERSVVCVRKKEEKMQKQYRKTQEKGRATADKAQHESGDEDVQSVPPEKTPKPKKTLSAHTKKDNTGNSKSSVGATVAIVSHRSPSAHVSQKGHDITNRVGKVEEGHPPQPQLPSNGFLSSPSTSIFLVIGDTVAVVIGMIAIVVTLLALTSSDVFEREDALSDSYMYSSAGAGSGNEGLADENDQKVHGSSGGQEKRPPSVGNLRKSAHSLLDGSVAGVRASLYRSLKRRLAVRHATGANLRRVAVESVVRNGKVPPTVAPLHKGDYHGDDFAGETSFDAKERLDKRWREHKKSGFGPMRIIAQSAMITNSEPEGRALTSPTTDIQGERDIFDDEATFFVAISQFKDVLCPNTVAELYAKARNPRRVFAGIVDQRDDNTDPMPNGLADVGGTTDNLVPKTNLDGTCVPWYFMPRCRLGEFCPTDNIRVRRTFPREGKGPTWGRYYAMLMYQGEKYFMGIDSHSRFVHHWDTQSVLNLHVVPKQSREKAVMSHYPGAFESYFSLMTPRREFWRMVMCAAHYTTIGIIRMDSVAYPMNGLPDMQPFSAGGYVFGNARFVHEVPFDPYLFYVFDGEEVLYSVRLWTHGFDLFTPRTNILFHNYARHNAPRFWNIKGLNYAAEQVFGNARVKYFMKSLNNGTQTRMVSDEWAHQHNVHREEEIYGLGKERPLEDYYAFARADPMRWTVNKSFCEELLTAEHGFKYHKQSDLGGF